ncbi:MAG TPA: extracellular solute-binding protein [Caproicibacter sp.]|nr:extracellular solute-binding protein [Caproicibacter sp.]
MKKVLALLLSVSIGLITLVGCSTATNTGKTTSEATASGGASSNVTNEPFKMTLWTFQEIHTSFYKKMAEKWNQANSDRKIVLTATTMPYDDMHNKLLIALQSGVGAPDIADIEIGKFSNFLKGTPQLLPLNDIVEPELKNIIKSRVDIYSKDGKYYGICFHVGATVTYYNMDIMKQAGIDPKTIKTWDQYHEAGKTVKQKTGKVMTTFETIDLFQPQLLDKQLGSDLMKEDGTANLATPELAQSLTFMRSMLKDGSAEIAPGGGHHQEEYYGFMNKGGSASITMPMWYMSRFTDYMPDLKGKMMILPCPVFKEGESRSVGLGGTGTAVTSQTKDPKLAKDFLAYCKLSKEGCTEIWNDLGFDPIRTDVWSDPAVKNAKNKFTDFFQDNPFDVLLSIKDEIPAIRLGQGYAAMCDKVKTTTFNKALTTDCDINELLKSEEAALK